MYQQGVQERERDIERIQRKFEGENCVRKIEIKRNKKMYLYMCKNLWGKREIEI